MACGTTVIMKDNIYLVELKFLNSMFSCLSHCPPSKVRMNITYWNRISDSLFVGAAFNNGYKTSWMGLSLIAA